MLMRGALIIWLLTIAGGMKVLADHSFRPGAAGIAPRLWPSSSAIVRPSNQLATAVVFLHPECPCSKATVEELDRLVAQAGGHLNLEVVFVQPGRWSKQRIMGSLWKKVQHVPGARTVIDVDGGQAAAFGARTSGHLFVFDRRGILVYSGGITASRGHAGDNAGLAAATQAVNSGSTTFSKGPVFGCGLRNG